MTRCLMHHVLVVLLLSCCFVAADLVQALANVEGAAASVGFADDDDKNRNTRLNNLLDFVDTNDQFDDVLENNFKSYSFNENDLCSKGNRILTPDDLLDAVVDDNLTNEKTGNQLTFTNVDGKDDPTYVTESFVDFSTLIVNQHIADGHFTEESIMKTSTTPTKIIHRQQITHQKQHTEAWIITTGKSPSHDNHTHQHDATGEVSSNQRQRSLLSCVSSASALARAVKRASTTKSSSTTTIKVCTSRIKMGSLNRRRRRRSRRHLQSSSYNGTNVTLTGLAGGIDFSNRSITFTCLLKRRCILDGEGISRIFYGTNAIISIDGFQFLNASSLVGDALGSGSALTLIGSSQVTIRDSSFVSNTALSVGGAIMINNSTLTLMNSRRKTQFLQNEATYGGAIFGHHATIQTNVTTSSPSGIITFQDNYAIGDGGAVYVTNSSVGWNMVTFEKNDASNGGAAMFIDTKVIMNNMYVFGNEANLTGGSFVFLRANVLINNSTFDSNNGNGTVEAITSNSSSVQVNDTTFSRSRWYVGSSTLNLTNSCLPQGSNCVLGSTCSNCCKPYISWSTKVGYYCGPNSPNVKKCFGSDGAELKNAVGNYASGDATIIANLTKIYGNISDWCTSLVSDWSNLFNNRASFNANISNWDTSNATTMGGMFSYASSFNQDISKWDTSKVVDISYMFFAASSFNQDISRWNTSKVSSMSFTFAYAPSFNQDISKWDTSKVQIMDRLFAGASNFNANISMWNVSKVNWLAEMFKGATSFNQDISGWDISKAYLISDMMLGAIAFNQNLCAWKNKCAFVSNFIFNGTSCPNQSITVCGTGPFCYTCP